MKSERAVPFPWRGTFPPSALTLFLALLTASAPPAAAQIQLVPSSATTGNITQFPATSVGQSSAPQSIGVELTAAQAVTSITANVSQGNNQEYKLGAITGCTVDGSTVNPASTVCTVPITFAPAYPGQRNVPLTVITSTGTYTVGLTGTGNAPQVALTPGIISTIAGGSANDSNGDGGPATSAELSYPLALAVDNAGNLYIADNGDSAIRKVTARTGIITTVAVISGAGALSLRGIALDSAGNLYIADQGNYVHKLDTATGVMTTLAGTGAAGYSGDGGPAAQAKLNFPEAVAVDNAGNVYIADTGNYRVRRVDAGTGIITTVVGDGVEGTAGDFGPASGAQINPVAIAIDSAGNIYIADTYNSRIRKITASTGIITTLADVATNALTVDGAGNLYFPAGGTLLGSSSGEYTTVERLDAAISAVTTVAGNSTSGYSGDGGLATAAELNLIFGVALDSAGNIYITDNLPSTVRKVTVNSSSLDFAQTPVGQTSSAQAISLSNIGNQPLTLEVPASGSNPSISSGFVFSGGDLSLCPSLAPASSAGSLPSGDSCEKSISFEPQTTNEYSGNLIFMNNALNNVNSTQEVQLSGGVGGGIFLIPTPLSFGTVIAGETTTSLVNLINKSASGFTVSGITFTGTNASSFLVQDTTCGNSTSISPKGSCGIRVGIIPQSTGNYSAVMQVAGTASGSNTSIVNTIAITAVANPGPAVSFSPASVNLTVRSGWQQGYNAFSVTLTNTGTDTLAISSITITGNVPDYFNHASNCGQQGIAPGGSCTFSGSFITPSGTHAGTYSANLVVHDNSVSGQETMPITVTVVSPTVSFSPTSLNFNSVNVGRKATLPVTITNTGSFAIQMADFAFAGTGASAFSHTSNCGQQLIAPGGTCTAQVSFIPAVAGNYSVTMQTPDSFNGSPQSITVTGTGGPAVSLSSTSLTFTGVNPGTTATQSITVTNSSTATLAVTGISLTGANAGSFSHASNCGDGTIAPQAACTIQVRFTPSASGSYSATLNIADSAANTPQSVTLTGTAP